MDPSWDPWSIAPVETRSFIACARAMRIRPRSWRPAPASKSSMTFVKAWMTLDDTGSPVELKQGNRFSIKNSHGSLVMSPLNITQPLGIWSIMATIRWCPIFPKWDIYQPLIQLHVLHQLIKTSFEDSHTICHTIYQSCLCLPSGPVTPVPPRLQWLQLHSRTCITPDLPLVEPHVRRSNLTKSEVCVNQCPAVRTWQPVELAWIDPRNPPASSASSSSSRAPGLHCGGPCCRSLLQGR